VLSGGEYISAVLNLLIAAYLISYYPRSVQRQFLGRPTPPLFGLLSRVIPVVGYLLAAGTIAYVVLRLSGAVSP